MRFKVTFDIEGCKGCGLCAAWCKKGLISFDKSYLNKAGIHPAIITNRDECVGCLNCALMCPDAVITIEKTDE